MEFLLLGPLELRDGDRVIPLGGAKQRALLAILLLHANEVVSRGRLIDGLWGVKPPVTAGHIVETYVSRLRRALNDTNIQHALATRSPGYMLRIDSEILDLSLFVNLVRDGRRALAERNPEVAAELLRQALALFRGPPLDDLAFFPFAQTEVARLAEMRLAALEDRIDADLAVGRSADLVSELKTLVNAHPLRERFCGQLMIAFYRAGRQAEGLDAYRRTRQHLMEDLGIEPSGALRRLEQAILLQEPSLELAPLVSGREAAGGLRPVKGDLAIEHGPAPGVAGLLRRLRNEAGLTQEKLVRAASLSTQSVSDLEGGINLTAREESARLLAEADLMGPERALFETAASGRSTVEARSAENTGLWAGPAAAALRTLPRDIAGFTGRDTELRLLAALDDAATGSGVVGIHAIGGMAGIGKTTLAVHAAHRLAGHFPDGQMFLPLHAHTPGQRPVDPADALASLLRVAGVAAQQIPAGLDARAARWRDYLAGKKVLLVLDDAAGHQQVRPLLPGTAGSLVLITSRRRLAALEDAEVISLDTLAPGEAATLLARLSGRPELDSAAGPAGEIARLCGYLPLAIGMLGSQLRHHRAWSAADLAARLAAARDRLELMHAENLSVAAAFGLSYRDLTAGQRRLFRSLGLHPGSDIDAYAAAALANTGLATARRYLEVLYDQHLLTEPARGRYRLHDLLREHARALAATGDPAGRAAAAGRLLDYYLHTALAASRHIVARGPARRLPPPGEPPACAPQLSTLWQATAWLEAERTNLHAVTGHAAASALRLHAIAIPAAMSGFLIAHGYWEQAAALHQTALTTARQAGDRAGQASALNQLGLVQWLTGAYPAATASFQQALALYRDLGDLPGQADSLNQLGLVQLLTGNYSAATAKYQTALTTARKAGDQTGQAFALSDLGALQALAGDYPAAAASHQQALDLYRDLGDRLGQGDALNGLGAVQKLTGNCPAATAAQQQALELFRDLGDDQYGQAGALNELGILQRLTGDYAAAIASHHQALGMSRGLGDDRLGQANALNELGIVQRLTGDYAAAAASHQQALGIFRDRGQRLGEAEALNNLGDLLTQSAASDQARDCHAQALAIARDLGVPLEEARALEGTGQSHLRDGNPGEGAAPLRQALAIYQRIGAPAARRVQETLLDHHARKDFLPGMAL